MSLKRILVVDDTPEVLAAIEELVRSSGYETLTAIDGETARQRLAAENTIGLVITDYQMPGMNGIELIGHVRRNYPDVKALLVTGDNSPETNARALAAGADAVFLKPVSWDDIGPKIAELLS
ncbi:MAG: response regulator [Candidatus Sungbacteria bacterium]|uniref:Response regulator n=1 Tax=Candidatus Sungiibacteriota bacterium TaxID=2750080 RepID=A0A933DSX3_9BACT|nr:response regulator [Candidatus Sungbacteria bacterium]